MLRPVYFLEDNMAVVFSFQYPAALDELMEIAIYGEMGKVRL